MYAIVGLPLGKWSRLDDTMLLVIKHCGHSL